jgi:hypothetical protein
MLPSIIPEPDLQSVLDAISRIKACDLQTSTIEEIFDLLKPLFDGYHIKTTQYHPNELHIYRTAVPYKATKISDLSYPPSHLTRMGRVNRDGKPVFYGCSDKSGSIIERRSKKGDKFMLSEWINTDYLLVNHVGYVDEILQNRGSKRLPDELARFQAIGEVSQIIAKFLSDVFTEKVDANENHKYKLSVAISEQLLTPIISDEGFKFGGLLYPSIPMFTQADNLALNTQFADNSMQVIKAEFWEVAEVQTNADNSIEYRCIMLDTASTFSEDGEIKWMGYS